MKAKQFYSYALDRNGRLINANDAIKRDEYICPSCGTAMILKQGSKRIWHFAHKRNLNNCSYETYLHKIAKRRIRKCFERSTSFKISFRVKVTCNELCPVGSSKPCDWTKIKSFELKNFYNRCEEEVSVGDYKADLLLTNSERPKIDPILIEICVSHKSTEAKLQSGYRIIEIKIESEEDIDDIVSNATICESDGYLDQWNEKPNDKIRFYNFKGGKDKPDEEHQAQKFIFWIDTKGNPRFNTYYKPIKCLVPNAKSINSSKFRIESKDRIDWDFAFQKLSESGLGIRYCAMCNFYHWNDYYNRCICTLYKSKGTKQYPKLSDAKVCPHFRQKYYNTNNQECKITINK